MNIEKEIKEIQELVDMLGSRQDREDFAIISNFIKKQKSELEKKDIIINHLINDLYDLAVAINEEYRVEEYLLNKETIKEYYSKRKGK